MRFIVASRRDIEKGIVVPTAYIVISISDPGSRRPRIANSAGFRGALYLQFHDAEPPLAGTASAAIVLMTAKHARAIWNFILEHWSTISTIVVHCEQGSSRSPAIVAGLAEILNIDVSDVLDWAQPNGFIVNLMRSVGTQIKGEGGPFLTEK